MDEKKIEAIQTLIGLGSSTPEAYIWLAIPAGIISGKPISFKEYYKLLTNTDVNNNDDDKTKHRFIYLKNVLLTQGGNRSQFNIAMCDPEDASAWGFYNPDTSYSMPINQ